jgi:hypothetical protein
MRSKSSSKTCMDPKGSLIRTTWRNFVAFLAKTNSGPLNNERISIQVLG